MTLGGDYRAGGIVMEENQDPSALESGPGVDPSHMLLIVTGAHLRAEMADRPLAYWLHDQVDKWLRGQEGKLSVPVAAVVCSDIWYLNQPVLQKRPTISVGGPGVNALTSFFYRRLDPALVKDNELIVQLDPEFVDLRVCLWGKDHARTVQAVHGFVDHYLDGYLRAVATQVEPTGE
ncbi:MAG: hypothetical protein IT443_05495 [Phycisphaeraceae bacterium]|nr:hypothetical protein [Phycisphaeraceae bacterium]